MRYTILVQNEKDPKLFKFLTVKEPVMKEIKTEVTDEETQEVKEVITYGYYRFNGNCTEIKRNLKYQSIVKIYNR